MTSSDAAKYRRKERRYKVKEDGALRCETTLANCALSHGTVIDLSPSGLRLLCEGNFEPGQAIFTELATSRSHGIYRGVIRRVEPWSNGKFVLGCSLEDKIPDDVLQELAHEGAVNRRSDPRQDLDNANAKLSWPLNPNEVDVELCDLSDGGMRIRSGQAIPAEGRFRFRIESADGDALIVEGRPVWLAESDSGDYTAGVTFTGPEDSKAVARQLHQESSDEIETIVQKCRYQDRNRRLVGMLSALAIGLACYFFMI